MAKHTMDNRKLSNISVNNLKAINSDAIKDHFHSQGKEARIVKALEDQREKDMDLADIISRMEQKVKMDSKQYTKTSNMNRSRQIADESSDSRAM